MLFRTSYRFDAAFIAIVWAIFACAIAIMYRYPSALDWFYGICQIELPVSLNNVKTDSYLGQMRLGQLIFVVVGFLLFWPPFNLLLKWGLGGAQYENGRSPVDIKPPRKHPEQQLALKAETVVQTPPVETAPAPAAPPPPEPKKAEPIRVPSPRDHSTEGLELDAARLTAARSMKFNTSQEAAREVGMAAPTYQEFELGKRLISNDLLVYFARMFAPDDRFFLSWFVNGELPPREYSSERSHYLELEAWAQEILVERRAIKPDPEPPAPPSGRPPTSGASASAAPPPLIKTWAVGRR